MLPNLLAIQPNAELHVIGDGPKRQDLQAQAMQLGVADSIRWWGWQTDAKPIYQMLDALLLPSRTEGLPNVVLEAMAMGVPVAATNVGGVADLLDHGDAGIILPEHAEAWAHRIAPLLTNHSVRASYTDLAYRRVRERFSFETRMQKMMAVYDKVLGRTSKAQPAPAPDQSPLRLAA